MADPQVMKRPTVSVVMSAFNAGPFLESSIQSILRQSNGDLELLVVDDGSTDDTWAILSSIREPRLRVWRQENGGKPVALNFLLNHVAGEFIAIQDADDLSHPCRLEKLTQRMQAAPDLGAIFSGYSFVINDKILAPTFPSKSRDDCRRDITQFRMPGHDPTMMCRTSIARKLRFDPTMPIVEGFDFILRLGEQFETEVIGEPLYGYRVVPTSLTQANITRRVNAVRMVLDKARIRRGLPPVTDIQFETYYGASARDPSNGRIAHFIESVYHQRISRGRLAALKTALQSLKFCPPSYSLIKPFIYALVPLFVAKLIRSRGDARRNSGGLMQASTG
jgi:glycosyltransferase involved in cell wall biosynthesis